jgi:kinetochore protein Fta7
MLNNYTQQSEPQRKRQRAADASERRVNPIKKRKSNTHPSTSSEEIEASPRFQKLKPRTREISHAIVKSKWTSLPAPAQQQVRELVKSAMRPVILMQRSERRRAEVESALSLLVKKLDRRVPRMPFPPKTKDNHFDLEKLLERNVRVQ